MRPKQVRKERWLAAQTWEAGFWARHESKARRKVPRRVRWLQRLGLRTPDPGDDSNHWWKERFASYDFLPPQMESVLEIGCGPYTNVRLLIEDRSFSRVVCSDPLARTYLDFEDRWLSRAHRSGKIEVDDSPAEDLPFEDGSFDLVMSINVFDHVMDFPACMLSIRRVLRPGGWVVIGQDLTNDEDRRAMEGDDMHLAGHTVFLTHDEIDEQLPEDEFERVFHKVLDRDAGRYPPYHYGTYLLAVRRRG